MAASIVYHWKHGWIPLDHIAALSKAKGNHDRAAKMLAAVHEAKGIHSRQDLAKSVLDLPNVTDPTHRAAARASIAEAAHRLGAQDLLPGSSKAAPGPADARAAFRMGGPELRQHAANGSTIAQVELDRRAAKHATPSAPTAPKTTTAPPTQAKPPAATEAQNRDDRKMLQVMQWASENRTAVPDGYSAKSRVSSTEAGGRLMGLHTFYGPNDERIGSVLDRKNGQHLALYDGKQLGDGYPTRRDAFAALAAKHEKDLAAARAKAALAARRHATAKPIGLFQPQLPPTDGTVRGNVAAEKIKQSFKMNNHTVHIETTMSKDQTKGFLDDVHAVLLKSGHMDSQGITFHVPSGDAKFRSSRGRITGGYVRQGQRTIFVNPKIANGAEADSFGGPSHTGDHLMPAASRTTGRQYVITHELGHVLDAEHGHTRESSSFQALGRGFTSTQQRSDASTLHRDHITQLSRYGRTNPQEGYAEAYAQWIHGGPGSSAAADAFAAKYGWVVPKWYREGRPRA